MPIKFPLGKKRISLGTVADPIVTLPVQTKFGYENFDFLLDTGADCTMLPKSLADELGIDLSRVKKERFYGIEGEGILVYIGRITLKIGKRPLRIRCVFSEKETTPFILGRMDIFSHFSIFFDNKNKFTQFIEI